MLNHCNTESKRLETKSLLGAEAYQENAVMNSSIAKSFLSPSNEDQEGLHIKMNTVYHLIKMKTCIMIIPSY